MPKKVVRNKQTVSEFHQAQEEVKQVKIRGKRQCTCCGEHFRMEEFYLSQSIVNKYYGRLSICKGCVKNIYEEYMKIYQIYRKAVFETCKLLDMPFKNLAFDGAENEVASNPTKNLMAIYVVKINSLGKANNYGNCFADSDKWTDDRLKKELAQEEIIQTNKILKTNYTTIPQDLIIKWGASYNLEQILRLEKFYEEMITTHFINTPQHRQILKFICKLNLKMDQCLEDDDLPNFAKLSQQYDKLLQSSGLRPIDKSSSDVTTGIRNFSTIFEEVEKDGFIEPTPITEKQDIIDKTIMYIMNYTIKLLNMNLLSNPPLDTPKVKED